MDLSSKRDDARKQNLEIMTDMLDPKYKIVIFIPHDVQRLEDATPFCGYTPGLLNTERLFIFACALPADIRELMLTPAQVLSNRVRRVIWPHIVPIEITALRDAIFAYPTPFKIVLTNQKNISLETDLILADGEVKGGVLHVSSISGDGRKNIEAFNRTKIVKYVRDVLCFYVGKIKSSDFYKNSINTIRYNSEKSRGEGKIINSNVHHVTKPNEVSLISYGWLRGASTRLVDKGDISDSKLYVDEICKSADSVLSFKKEIWLYFDDVADNYLIVTVPSYYWFWYGSRKRPDNKDGEEWILFKYLRSIIYQDSYSVRTDLDTFRGGGGKESIGGCADNWRGSSFVYRWTLALGFCNSYSSYSIGAEVKSR